METLISFVLKHLVIFIGSGIVTLFAYWLLKEVSTVSKVLFQFISKKLVEGELKVTKRRKVSSLAGLYEVALTEGKKIKLFSTHKTIRVI